MAGDVTDADSLAAALDGVAVAYYLVHSLDDDDFERKDAEAARTFAAAAADAPAGADRLPRWPRPRERGAVGASALPARGGGAAGCRAGAGDRAAGGDRHRPRRHLLGDHPPAGRPPAGHDRAAMGDHQDPADRAAGRDPLPGRGAGAGRGAGPDVRDRWAGGADLRRDDAAGRPTCIRSAAADARGAPADAAAVVVLACPRHRCGHRDRAQPGRLDEQRGGGATTPRSSTSCPAGPMGYDEAVRQAFDQREAALAREPGPARHDRPAGAAWSAGRSAWCARCWSTRSTATTGSPTGRSCGGGSSSASRWWSARPCSACRSPPSRASREFYLLTFALAATWALGSVAVRPAAPGPHRASAANCGARSSRRSSSGCCWPRSSSPAGWSSAMIPFLARLTEDVLGYARYGTLLAGRRDHPGERHRRGAVLPRRAVRGDRRPAPGAHLDRDLHPGDGRRRQPGAGLRRRGARRGRAACSGAPAAASSPRS